jgi:streptomycin 6-kinase
MELAGAAETLELMGLAQECALHGDLVPANVLRDTSGTLFVVDPQATAGDPCSAVASWGLLRGNGDEQGWRAGGGAIRRALLVGSLLSCPSERVLAHLSFQAFEIACRQASWEQWDWVAESIELGRRAREMLA